MIARNKKPELLAPAGDLKKLKFAFAYGADAVYAGLPFCSLRTKENKFDIDTIKESIQYTKALGKKIYITANIYAHNSRIEQFLEIMDKVVPLKPDAFIMSDSGLIHLAKAKYPDLCVHLSTQANNTNWAQVKFWKAQGISRVILARELSLEEIEEITTRNIDTETEVFIHGSMCVSYSGRCLLSDYFTNKGSNTGDCTQSCRWIYKLRTKKTAHLQQNNYQACFDKSANYSLSESKRPDLALPIIEDEFGTYILNSKDLCTIDILPDIIQTGVNSLKIEGRNKNLLYLATTVKLYREAIDAVFDGTYTNKLDNFIETIMTLERRNYTHGFYRGVINDSVYYNDRHLPTHEIGCLITRLCGDGILEIDIKNKLSVGDEVEWLTPKGVKKEIITKIFDNKNNEINEVSAGNKWTPKILSTLDLDEFSIMRIKTNLNESKNEPRNDDKE